jgi:hypothetical protein
MCARLVSGRFACDRRRPPVADMHQPFVGERNIRMPYGAGFQPLELVQFGNRWEGVTGSEFRRPDRRPQFVSGLLPFGPLGQSVQALGPADSGAR